MRRPEEPVGSAGRSVFALARPAAVSAVFFLLIAGLAYPLVTTVAASLLFPWQARGSLIEHGGVVIGSARIAQAFVAPDRFHPRPSATAGLPYDAAASGGSNLGPTNPRLFEAVEARARAYRLENGLAAEARVPVDAVTASGSGLDPHISIANAELQARRVATHLHRSEDEIVALVRSHTSPRVLGFLGEPVVDVLRLNLALESLPLGPPP